MVSLLVVMSRRVLPGMFVISRFEFVGSCSCLCPIKREENLLKDIGWNRLVIKLGSCFKAFSFATISGVFLHVRKEDLLEPLRCDGCTSLFGFMRVVLKSGEVSSGIFMFVHSTRFEPVFQVFSVVFINVCTFSL